MNMRVGVACLGDSITYTNSSRAAVPYPLQLELLCGPAYYVANAGIGGNRTDQIRTRWTATIRHRGFQWLILQGGINDIVQGYPSAETAGEAAAGNLLQIVDEALADGMQVVLMNLFPMGNYSGWNLDRQEQMNLFNELLSEYVPPLEQRERFQLLDVYGEFGASPPNAHKMRAEYDAGDGLHPGSVGTARAAEIVRQQMAAMLM